MGFASPMLYLVFFMLYPNENEQIIELVLAFVAGIFLDIFADTVGVHAASTLCVVFLRPVLMQFFFGKKDSQRRSNLQQASWTLIGLYMLFFVFLHQSIFYLLEVFNVYHLEHFFKRTLVSTLLTTVVCILVSFIVLEQKASY